MEIRGVCGPADSLGHGALSQEGDLFAILGMEFLHDIVSKFIVGNREEGNFAAAGDNGRQEEFDLRSEQNKVGVRRRFFEGLEERIAASGKHLLSIVNDEDLDRSFKRRKTCFLDELTHISDGMLIAFRIRKDQMDVRMFFFSPAHEKFCDLVGKKTFSNTIGSMQ